MSSSIGIKLTKAYDLYRNSPIGLAMFDALYELLKSHKLTLQQALIVVSQFDYSIRRVMSTKYSKQDTFSFEAQVMGYRLYPDWCVMLLEDVDFYQHFPPRIVQLYKNKKDPASKRKCTSNNVYKKFLNKAHANDVKALIQQVPIMLLISKSSSVSISSTGPFYDRKFGKCEKAEEIREFIHPRMSVYLLEKNTDPNAACKESEVEDDNALPVVMLNRFKNSSMFSDIPKPEMDVSEYYSRKITLDPSYQKKFTYINSFGNRKTKSSSSKEKIEHEALKDQVGKLQKDLKSKDEEIANMKAAMRNIKK